MIWTMHVEMIMAGYGSYPRMTDALRDRIFTSLFINFLHNCQILN